MAYDHGSVYHCLPTMFDKFSWIIVSSAFRLLLLLLLGEWAYPCSEDVVICVQFVVVEFVAVLGTSLKYCLFSIMRVPFLSSNFDDQLDSFWRGFSRWNKDVWCCFPATQSLLQYTVRLSSRSLFKFFFMMSRYCLFASSLVFLIFFSSRLWSQLQYIVKYAWLTLIFCLRTTSSAVSS